MPERTPPEPNLRNPGWMLTFCILSALCALSLGAPVSAQELRVQPTPFTAWLDLKALSQPGAPRPPLPIWLESVEIEEPEAGDVAPQTTYRIRFRKLTGINDEMMVRCFFADKEGSRPVITAWTEIGDRLLDPKTLGSGLGLPTSETFIIPMTGVDYVDIAVPGDGAGLRGVFLSSVRKSTTRQALDFDPPQTLADPFQGVPAAQPGTDDISLFGRVRATLDNSIVKLSGTNPTTVAFEFELAKRPEIAIATFEILNPDVVRPPDVSMNLNVLGSAAMILPDLADPAYYGTVRPMQQDVNFRYTGWVKCQKVIPGSSLQPGQNTLFLQVQQASEETAIRAVEMQFKYE